MQNSSLKKNITFVAIGNFSTKILNFLLVPLYTYAMSTGDFGISDIIFTSTTLAFPLLTLVIFEAVLRYLLDNEHKNEDVIAVGIVITLIGLAVSVLISPIIFLFDSLKNYYFLFLLYYITQVVYNNLLYVTRGLKNFKVYSLVGFINSVLLIAFNVLFLVVLRWGIDGYLLSYIISMILCSILFVLMNKINIPINQIKHLDIDLAKEMIKYSAPLVPNSLGWWINNSLDKYFIIYFFGASLNGIYSIAYKIPSVLSSVSNIFNITWQVSFVDAFERDDAKKYFSDIYYKFVSFQFLVSAGVILLSKPLAYILYQNNFFEAWKYVPILVMAVTFHGIGEYIGSLFIAKKATKFLFYSTLIGALVNLIGNLILIPMYKAYGAAIATLISFFVIFIFRIVISNKIFKFSIRLINDILSIIVLLFDAFYYAYSLPYLYLISSICLIVICIFRFEFIVTTFKYFFTKTKSIFSRS